MNEIETSEVTRESSQIIIDQICEKLDARNSLLKKYMDEGESKFEKIRKKFSADLTSAIQENYADAHKKMQEQLGSEEEQDEDLKILRAESCRYCLMCGALNREPDSNSKLYIWYGIGETENCKCGADYTQRTEKYKFSLNSYSIATLLQIANEVEKVYNNTSIQMTYEQISLNRNYLDRILKTLVTKSINHFPDRYLQSMKAAQLTEHSNRMLKLMNEVLGDNSARAFIRSGDCPDFDTVTKMIADLELQRTAKEVLRE